MERDLSLAWHVEGFHRQKELPPLKTVLARTKVGKQSGTDLLSAMQMISAQYGIPMRVKKKES